MSTTDNGREAGQIFLDLAQVFDYGEDAVNLAAQRFVESGSVTADLDDAGQNLDLDISRMIYGALFVIKPLISITATNWGVSEEEAVAHLRRLLDENLS